MNTINSIGLILSAVGGTLELAAIAVAGLTIARSFGRIDKRFELIRSTAEEHINALAKIPPDDQALRKAQEQRLKDLRKNQGIEPDTTWDDLSYLKTLITHAIADDARSGLVVTGWMIGLGVLLSSAGSVVGAFG